MYTVEGKHPNGKVVTAAKLWRVVGLMPPDGECKDDPRRHVTVPDGTSQADTKPRHTVHLWPCVIT